jgi:hypothetical protein
MKVKLCESAAAERTFGALALAPFLECESLISTEDDVAAECERKSFTSDVATHSASDKRVQSRQDQWPFADEKASSHFRGCGRTVKRVEFLEYAVFKTRQTQGDISRTHRWG